MTQDDSFKNQLVDHIPFLWHTAKRFQKNDDDAKDLIQDTLYKALKNKRKLRDVANVRGWLKTILKNAFIDQFNQNKRCYNDIDINSVAFLQDSIQDPILYPLFHYPNISFYYSLSDSYNLAFNSLPAKYRNFIMLRDIEGYSYRQIAEFLGCPVGTVRSMLHIGRKIMVKKYKKLHLA